MECKVFDPSKVIFNKTEFCEGEFIFEDGSVGYIADPDFDVSDYIYDESFDFSVLRSPDDKRADEVLREYFNGKLPIGNIYIDRFLPDGDFVQGGCFLIYEGESLKDYCERNDVPLPVRIAPYGLCEAIENSDKEQIEGYIEKFPELSAFRVL